MRSSLLPLCGALLACCSCAPSVETVPGQAEPVANANAAIAAETSPTAGSPANANAAATGTGQPSNGPAAPDSPNAPGAGGATASATAVAISGTAPSVADGKTLYVRALDQGGAVVAQGNATVASGKFAVTLAAAAGAKSPNSVVAYVDLNGDGICSIAPSDFGATIPVAAGKELTLTLEALGSPPCEAFGDFSLAAGGSDFTPHTGQALYGAVRDVQAKVYVTQPKGVRVVKATWSLNFAGALVKGRTYEFRYFADVAGSNKCQNHSWLTKIPTVTANTTLPETHDTAQTPVCDSFPPLPVGATVAPAEANP